MINAIFKIDKSSYAAKPLDKLNNDLLVIYVGSDGNYLAQIAGHKSPYVKITNFLTQNQFWVLKTRLMRVYSSNDAEINKLFNLPELTDEMIDKINTGSVSNPPKTIIRAEPTFKNPKITAKGVHRIKHEWGDIDVLRRQKTCKLCGITANISDKGITISFMHQGHLIEKMDCHKYLVFATEKSVDYESLKKKMENVDNTGVVISQDKNENELSSDFDSDGNVFSYENKFSIIHNFKKDENKQILSELSDVIAFLERYKTSIFLIPCEEKQVNESISALERLKEKYNK